jgi:undecaprenyl-diphosphatase
MLHGLLQFDSRVLTWITTHRIGIFDTPLWLLSVVGRGGIVWIATGIGLVVVKRISLRGFLQLALAVLLASVLADRVLKPLVHRERPFERISDLRVVGGRPHDASFPSGHSANAFASALVLARLAPAAAPVWWTLAALIAFSRVYLGVHHPLDVIAGALLGLACGALALRVRWRTRAS